MLSKVQGNCVVLGLLLIYTFGTLFALCIVYNCYVKLQSKNDKPYLIIGRCFRTNICNEC